MDRPERFVQAIFLSNGRFHFKYLSVDEIEQARLTGEIYDLHTQCEMIPHIGGIKYAMFIIRFTEYGNFTSMVHGYHNVLTLVKYHANFVSDLYMVKYEDDMIVSMSSHEDLALMLLAHGWRQY